MAQKFLTDIELEAGLVDGSNGLGSNGQVLSSTGSGVSWVDFESDTAKALEIDVKNVHGSTLAKGTVVHAEPTGILSGNVIEVVAADANVAANMPAIGVLNEALLNDGEGKAVMFGTVQGIDTSSFSVGDELYVSTTAGALTNTKPTATTELVQKIAIVIKSHASNGLIKVFGAGRSNDVPNLVDRTMTFSSFLDIYEYIRHSGDNDTYIRFLDDRLDFRAGNLSFIDLREGTSPFGYFNVSNNDIDFQFRGTTNNNLIRTDAGNDRVGIGGTPDYNFDVKLGNNNSMRVISTDDNTQIIMSDDDTTAYFGVKDSKQYMSFTSGSPNTGFYITSGGNGTFAGDLTIGTNDFTAGTATIGGILIQDSADRSGLLEINRKGTSTWSGTQIKHNTQLWSWMGNATDAGLFDDTNGKWAYLYNINSSLELRYNGTTKITTTSAGADINGDLTVEGGDIILEGTGRIQGVDTVSAGTDAVNKDYVDDLIALETLDTVTSRGSTTSNSITTGNIEIQNSGRPTLTLDDNGNAGGGGAEGVILFKNNDGNAIGLGYTGDVTSTSDFIISTDAGSTYGGYLDLAATAIDDPSDIILDPKTKVLVTKDLTITGDLIVNGTETILNTQTVEVEDNIIQLNTTQGTPDTATATTSGISIYRGDGVTQASFIFDDADDTWDLTNNLVVDGNGTFNELTLTGSTDNLTITESSGDWTFNNAQQNNGITIYDGTGGIDFKYNGTAQMAVNTNGVEVYNGFDFSVDTDLIYADSTNNRVGIGKSAPNYKLEVNGQIASSTYIIAGLGSGGVALTDNDGYGNANVTFNHVSGTPEQDGSSGRIVVTTDSTTAKMSFELKDNVTSGVAVDTPIIMELYSDSIIANKNLRVRDSGGGIINLDRNDTSIVDGNPLGRLRFSGDDPTAGAFNRGAEIRGEAAGTWSTNNYPTELQFYTTATNTDLLALKLDSSQNATFSGTLASSTQTITSSDDQILSLNQTSGGWSYIGFESDSTRNFYVGQDSNENFVIGADTAADLSFVTFDDIKFQAANIINTGNILPNVDSTYNIGTNTLRFANVYADNFHGLAKDLEVTSNDTFNGTYSLLWHDGADVYSSTWMTVTGSTDTFSVPNISTESITIVDGTNDVNLYFANTSYGIQLDYSAGDMFFRTNGATRLTVDNDGNTRFYGTVGINMAPPSAYQFATSYTQTDPNADFRFAHFIDANFSGADNTTSDREQGGIFIDIDSSADGDGSDEHRLYGIYIDQRFTGFSDSVTGVYSRVESNNSTEKTASIQALHGIAVHDSGASGGVSSIYGGKFETWVEDDGDMDNSYGVFGKVLINSTRAVNVGTTHGGYFEVQTDSPNAISYGTMHAVKAVIDNNEGAVPTFVNQYLLFGSYQGTKGSNAYGLYLEAEDKNYLSSKLGIGVANPDESLHVVSDTNNVAVFETTLTSDMAIELKNSQGSMFFGLGGGEEFAIGTDADLNGSNSKFVVKSTGDVGIGTTSPQRKLHLHESSSSGSFIAFTNDTTGQTITDGAIVGIDGGEDMLISTYEDKNIEFRTGNTERMRIDSSGQSIFYGDVTLDSDSTKLKLGDNQDLQLYHDGANSYIETSTSSAGDLYIKAQGTNHDLYLIAQDDIYIRPKNGENGIVVNSDGAVDLYHNNSLVLSTASNSVNISKDQLTFTNDAASSYVRAADALLIQSDYNGGEDKPIYLQPSATTQLKIATSESTFYHPVSVETTGANGIELAQDQGTPTNSGRLFFTSDSQADTFCIVNTNGTLSFRSNATAGSTSGDIQFQMVNDGDLQVARYIEHYGDTNSYLGWSAADDFRIYVGGRELVRLDEGTDPDIAKFMTDEFRMYSNGDFHADGDIVAYSTTASSDKRLKKNIKPIDNALDIVDRLQGVHFNWKKDDKKSIGYIAQDVEKILPEMVSEKTHFNEGEFKTVNYAAMVSIMGEAIKELKAEVEQLKKQINGSS